MNRTRKSLTYLLLDFLASYLVWMLFFLIRRFVFESNTFAFNDHKVFVQLIPATVVSAYWVFMYAVGGLYTDPYRKSRFNEIIQVFKVSLIGVIFIFFLIFLNDPVPNQQAYRYHLYYFFLQFFAVGFIHFLVSTNTNIKIRKRKIGFPTLIIGCGDKAAKLYEDLNGVKKSLGFDFKGFLSIPGTQKNLFRGRLKHFGDTSRLIEVINNRRIEEVVIALDPENKDQLPALLDILEGTTAQIKILPEIYDYVLGRVKTTHILGSPLIEISPKILTTTEAFLKRSFDVFTSVMVLLLLSPMYLILAIAVKVDSKGPIFFRQERIGKGGKPFRIIKYRTMYTDAEKFGPALSKDDDPRITKIGKILRKTRLDEFPQFWNVLKGEMSIVGPRPERQFFIDQIVQKAPHYRHLHRVRPGITSWGQVKFGYAENVDEMVERLKFDILYIENLSLALDVKILLYTVITMVEGRGK